MTADKVFAMLLEEVAMAREAIGRLNHQLEVASQKAYAADQKIQELERAKAECDKPNVAIETSLHALISYAKTDQKIGVIKEVRRITGLSLLEAKNLVDSAFAMADHTSTPPKYRLLVEGESLRADDEVWVNGKWTKTIMAGCQVMKSEVGSYRRINS